MPDYNRYFQKFNTINYNNYKVVDITERTVMVNKVYNNPFLYHPYQLNEGDRADSIAYSYYGDQYTSWIIYLSNKILDPYYQWPLDYDKFNEFIIKKYGSIEYAQKKVYFYRVEWSSDDSIITKSFFDNNLDKSGKKYWTALFAPNGNIINYKRKELETTVNVNYDIKLNINAVSNSVLSNGEFASIKLGSNIVGNCEIATANSTVLRIINTDIEDAGFPLSGNLYTTLTTNGDFGIYGQTSNASANINSYVILQRNIPITEQSYWSSVSYYDYENELNEERKTIYLLDKGNLLSITKSLESSLL